MTARELARLAPLLVLYLLALWLFPEHSDDESGYLALAERLTHGRYVTGDSGALLDADPSYPDLWFGPGLPGVLAPLVALDLPTALLRHTGPAFLFAAVVLFYVLSRARFGPRTALISTYAFGLYPPFWALLTNLHSEPLAILCMCGAMVGIAGYVDKGGRAPFVLAVAALAGLALTRVAYGWVLMLVLAVSAAWWLLARSRVASRTAAVVAAALAVCSPWLAYTYAQTERPLVWGNSGSLSLYWMASPYRGDVGDWRQVDEVFTDPDLAPHRPFFARLRGLTIAEQNARIEREAIHNILEHPWSYAGNVAANVSRLLFNTPYSDGRWQRNDLYYALPNGLLAAAVGLSVIVLTTRRRALPPETVPFALIGTVALLLHVLVAAYPRMLAPIVPLAVWMTTLSLTCIGVLEATPFRSRNGEARAPGTPAQTATRRAASADRPQDRLEYAE